MNTTSDPSLCQPCPQDPTLMCGTNAKSATFVYRNNKNNGEYFLEICSLRVCKNVTFTPLIYRDKPLTPLVTLKLFCNENLDKYDKISLINPLIRIKHHFHYLFEGNFSFVISPLSVEKKAIYMLYKYF